MTGLALEGGGSRGAYHVGVMKALLEAGYVFDGFVGTSVGAINAAAFAQGDFDEAERMWLTLTNEVLFDAEVCDVLKFGDPGRDLSQLLHIRNSFRKIIAGNGADTSRIMAIVRSHIDEDKMRASGKDFGLVAASINDRRPYELFTEDMNPGDLTSYIVASACLPGFRPVSVGGKYFLDGGLYNNCPINMLMGKGYREIIAVRTMAPGVFKKVTALKDVDVRVIVPSADLGNMLQFSPGRARAIIALGYADAIRSLRGITA